MKIIFLLQNIHNFILASHNGLQKDEMPNASKKINK